MYNNIIAAGSGDRPPMLATGRYAKWQSCVMRYINTRPNGDVLRKCILQGEIFRIVSIAMCFRTTGESSVVAYLPVASIGGRSPEPAAMMLLYI
nr:Gag-Pol polyprotein [Tanacetum cinerariifolium]